MHARPKKHWDIGYEIIFQTIQNGNTSFTLISHLKTLKIILPDRKPASQSLITLPPLDLVTLLIFCSFSVGEIPVFLGCPDVDPMHSPKIGYSFCSQ